MMPLVYWIARTFNFTLLKVNYTVDKQIFNRQQFQWLKGRTTLKCNNKEIVEQKNPPDLETT